MTKEPYSSCGRKYLCLSNDFWRHRDRERFIVTDNCNCSCAFYNEHVGFDDCSDIVSFIGICAWCYRISVDTCDPVYLMDDEND